MCLTVLLVGAREEMIDAGERLAAERGIAAMSLREVQAAAGQRNKSAAQYHFGSRTGLIEAIAAARMGPINEVRRQLLDELDGGDAPTSVRDVVEAIVHPLAEATLRPGSCWARFLAQGLADPEINEVVRRTFEAGPYRDALHRLLAAMTDVPEALRQRRVDHAIGTLVLSLAAAEGVLAAGGRPRIPTDAQVADLVDICTAVLEAPASSATVTALAAKRRRPA
jgi:AcrR family transcriptional regulator